jgi:hypothetical protein
MRKTLMFLATMLLAVTASAAPSIFNQYETVRQALLKDSVPTVKASAVELAKTARAMKQPAVAAKADAVAKSADLKAAREAFGELSAEMVKYRATVSGPKPAVYTCPMANKDWLQAKGDVSNPYYTDMRECGSLKQD